jgi:protein-S-isoprenylcysteine O-methyltransferase Ste14
MARFLAHLLPLLMLSSAYAVDVKDAPIPEAINWVGIIIFLVLFVGGSVGFIWMIYRHDKKTKQDEKQNQT